MQVNTELLSENLTATCIAKKGFNNTKLMKWLPAFAVINPIGNICGPPFKEIYTSVRNNIHAKKLSKTQ